MKLFGRGGGLEGSTRIFKKSKRLQVDPSMMAHDDHDADDQQNDDEGAPRPERSGDSWLTPYPDDPNESVRVIRKGGATDAGTLPPEGHRDISGANGGFAGDDQPWDASDGAAPQTDRPSSTSADLYGDRFDAEGAGEVAPAAERPSDAATEGQTDALPEEVRDALADGVPSEGSQNDAHDGRDGHEENLVSRYGGKYASVGGTSARDGHGTTSSYRKRMEEASRSEFRGGTVRVVKSRSTRASGPHASHSGARGQHYDGFARRLDEMRAEEQHHQEAMLASNTEDGMAIVPVHKQLTPEEYDSSIRWQYRFGIEAGLYRSNLIAAEARTVADVGCGVGRLSIHLAEWGFEVLGIDPDENMVAYARDLVVPHEEAIEHAQGQIAFKVGTLAGLADKIGEGSVDSVLCVGDVLTGIESVEQLRAALVDFNRVIAPDGVLILSFTNYRKLAYERRRASAPRVTESDGGNRLYVDLYDYPAGGQYVDVERLVGVREDRGAWAMASVRERHFVVTADMLGRELVEAGFDVIEEAGNFEGSRISPLESDMVMVVARRRHRMRQSNYR